MNRLDLIFTTLLLAPLATLHAADAPSLASKPPTTSYQQMNDYARWMKEQGFQVLSYFVSSVPKT